MHLPYFPLLHFLPWKVSERGQGVGEFLAEVMRLALWQPLHKEGVYFGLNLNRSYLSSLHLSNSIKQ